MVTRTLLSLKLYVYYLSCFLKQYGTRTYIVSRVSRANTEVVAILDSHSGVVEFSSLLAHKDALLSGHFEGWFCLYVQDQAV